MAKTKAKDSTALEGGEPAPVTEDVPEAPDALPPGHVRARVTKAGDGKISTGAHIAGQGEVCFKRGDIVTMPREAAEALENKVITTGNDGKAITVAYLEIED